MGGGGGLVSHGSPTDTKHYLSRRPKSLVSLFETKYDLNDRQTIEGVRETTCSLRTYDLFTFSSVDSSAELLEWKVGASKSFGNSRTKGPCNDITKPPVDSVRTTGGSVSAPRLGGVCIAGRSEGSSLSILRLDTT